VFGKTCFTFSQLAAQLKLVGIVWIGSLQTAVHGAGVGRWRIRWWFRCKGLSRL